MAYKPAVSPAWSTLFRANALQSHQPSSEAGPSEPPLCITAATVGQCARSDVGLPRAAVVGVLGGGQLGKMLATEAARDRPHSLCGTAAAFRRWGLLPPRAQPASSAWTPLTGAAVLASERLRRGRRGAAGQDGRPRQGVGPDARLPGRCGGRAHARQLQGPGHDPARARPHPARLSAYISAYVMNTLSAYAGALHSALCCRCSVVDTVRLPPAWPPRERAAAAQCRVQPAWPCSARQEGGPERAGSLRPAWTC